MNSSAKTAYVPALDGLRAVSILLVLLAHGGLERVVPGGLGVMIFFFISGLLITGQLLDEHTTRQRIDLRQFYLRRALRLLPACIAFVLVSGLAFTLLGGIVRPLAWAGALLYGANYVELFSRGFDSNLHQGTLLVPHPFVTLWSLAIEEHAYIVWPPLLALLLASGMRRHRWTAAVLLAVALASLAWRLHLAPLCDRAHPAAMCGIHAADRIYKGTDTRLDSIAWGALTAILLRSRAAAGFLAVARRRAVIIASLAVLATTLVVRDPMFRDTWRFTWQSLSLLILVPVAITSEGSCGRILSHPVSIAIGRLSYGLYLWHWLALMLVLRAAPAGALFVVAFGGLTFAAALGAWVLIERPMMRWRRRAGSHASASLGAGVAPAATANTASGLARSPAMV